MENTIRDKIIKNIGIVVALAFIIISLIKVLSTTKEYMFAGKNTLIFSHYQMEDGYREGLQKVINNYIEEKKKLGIDVNIIQTVVPWNGYTQWAITQLIGGKPSDILQMAIEDVYIGKYFMPLDQYIKKPNPYNAGTPIEGLPWQQTFIDNMDGAWRSSLLGYYGVGDSVHTWRIFYNKDLLEEITGSPEPPKTFEEWLEKCKQIDAYSKKSQKIIVPIVVRGTDGSTVQQFLGYYSNSMFYDWLDKIDLDISTRLEPLEIYFAKKRKLFTWNDEEIKAPIMMLAELSKYFSKGFASVDLEQSKFLFLQGKAVFLPEGSWQSKSMLANAPFKIGVFEIPYPGNDSQYRKFFDGEITEVSVRSYGTIGIPRKCRNIELAVDFLMYITSYKQNILWNESSMWMPSVRFVELSSQLKPFKPNVNGIPGITPWPPVGFHGYFMRTQREFQQNLTRYLLEQQGEGKYTYEKLLEDLENSYNRLAKEDTDESLLDKLRNTERLEYNMSWLEVNEEYFKDDVIKMTGVVEKKRILLEGIGQNESIYVYWKELSEKCFK
jgi:raffinose/stachyose/melibiose transport system substrate-binding protein